MEKKPKRPRLQPAVKLIDRKTYEDHNQKKPNPTDPNEVEATPNEEVPNLITDMAAETAKGK